MSFINFRKITYVLSAILIVSSIVSIFYLKEFNYGIDFTGGLEIHVKFNESVNESDIRDALEAESEKFGSIVIQTIGQVEENVFIIKSKKTEVQEEGATAASNTPKKIDASDEMNTTEIIRDLLVDKFGAEKVQLPFLKIDNVGPKIGQELKGTAAKLIIVSLIAILIYITIRFQFKFAVAAIIALIHDVTITLGIFSYMDKEINIPIIAAVLFIIGYSLNDTIVVFDRIRENLKLMHGQKFLDIVNGSIRTTLNRTVITSITTLLAAVSLFVWGPAVIHDFAFAFIIGIIAGTYSSIFVASPVLYDWWESDARKKRK